MSSRCGYSPVEAINARSPSAERESTGDDERRNTPTGQLKNNNSNNTPLKVVLTVLRCIAPLLYPFSWGEGRGRG